MCLLADIALDTAVSSRMFNVIMKVKSPTHLITRPADFLGTQPHSQSRHMQATCLHFDDVVSCRIAEQPLGEYNTNDKCV